MFGTYIGCMDGRLQQPVDVFAEKRFGISSLDRVCGPGIVALLAGKPPLMRHHPTIDWFHYQAAEISAGVHKAQIAFVVGHMSCAGNRVSDEEHVGDVLKATGVVQKWGIFKEVVPLFFRNGPDGWHPLELSRRDNRLKASGR